MKKLLLVITPFVMITSANAGEITSRITDSVQLTVEGPAIQSTRIGSSYSVSGSNIEVSTLGGLTGASATAPATISAGDYDIKTDGQPFQFTESITVGDAPVTVQTAQANGIWAQPNLYGNSTTSAGGSNGALAGTLSATGVPTVTAGGPGTTAIGQRTIELSVFN